MKPSIKLGLCTLLVSLLLISAIVPAMGAQPEDKNSVSVEKALEHANAYMMYFTAENTPGFEKWNGASIDPKPLELYDINGTKLYYLFSVKKEENVIGKMKVGANKKLGASVLTFEFNPIPMKVEEALKKSIEIGMEEYPNCEISSTVMVLYSYPKIGAMSVVIDSRGEMHRIIVDAHTLEKVPDKKITETENGIWSVYEQISDIDVDDNIKKWNDSDKFTEAIKNANKEGISTSEYIAKNQIFRPDYTKTSSKFLNVPLYGGETVFYCAPATAQMIAAYYGVQHTQDYIYGIMDDGSGGGCTNAEQLTYYKSSDGLNKKGSKEDTSPQYYEAVSEIDHSRPLKCGVTGHARVCTGYLDNGYPAYLAINDPSPMGQGSQYLEAWGSVVNYIYVRD
ncbi:C39 family peptidase [Methanococcoides seepicolus]|uniref:C39 family peptidase n=1 Tax=Methanococcoides seepicolus TaxID=2828780 RepID=A0A9E5DBP3_9EURY|nr:C39 family peptidase [Methanococcoides seepicolus]MCM1986349.1 C39 family peptidase [Methanococcoides seepicolus]